MKLLDTIPGFLAAMLMGFAIAIVISSLLPPLVAAVVTLIGSVAVAIAILS